MFGILRRRLLFCYPEGKNMQYTDQSESIRKNQDFQTVYRYGKSAANRSLVVYRYPRAERKKELEEAENSGGIRRVPSSWKMVGPETNRVGISVSKKVGNSVVRHHLCRLVRESYRRHDQEFDRGLDLVVIVRPGARELSFSEIERALLNLSDRLRIRKAEG